MPSANTRSSTGDGRWTLVTRVAASRPFSRAAQLRELLLYLAEKAIAAPGEDISEQEIGCRVLGRRPDYDPQADNIVRVQIRHLRQKLDEYFATEGLQEPVVVTVPKGSHVVRFDPRPAHSPNEAPASSTRLQTWIGFAVAMIAVGTAAFLVGRYSVTPIAPPVADPAGARRNPVWVRLFQKDQPTTLVIADSSLVVVENVLRKSVTLNEYVDRSYRGLIEAVPERSLREALRMISARQYTSLADASIAGEMRSLGERLGAKVRLRYSRHMNVRDFNSGNFVLVGSRHSVPWVELFEPRMNFRFESAGKVPVFGFRNRQPASGEREFYGSATPLSGPQDSYATLCLLPNLTRTGAILILSGITMEATEAAGEFLVSGDLPRLLVQAFGEQAAGEAPDFEILLKTAAISGAPHKAEVVAWRKPAI